MDVFPPILTNRSPSTSSAAFTSPKVQQQPLQNQPRRVHFETITSTSNTPVDPATTEKPCENGKQNQDEEGRMQQTSLTDIHQEQPESDSATRSQVHPQQPPEIAASDSEAPAAKFYFKYPVKDGEDGGFDEDEPRVGSPCGSDLSDFVENDWSDSEGSSSRQRSKEAQEAELQNKYRDAISQLNKKDFERAAAMFTSILAHPLMGAYHVADWEAFDWNRTVHGGTGGLPGMDTTRMYSNMAKIYFNVNLAMALLVENSIPFYMQALSLRPDFDDLWFICGQTAFKQGDWRTAQFCFSRCAKEFRAMEALLMVHYLNGDFAECFQLLDQLFELHHGHELGHVIRTLIAEDSPIWKELHEKHFASQALNHHPTEKQKEKVLERIDHFRQNRHCHLEKKKFEFNLFDSAYNRVLPKFAPLQVKLRFGMKMEELGKLLCDIFDRIEAFASFAEQEILWQLDTEDVPSDGQMVAIDSAVDMEDAEEMVEETGIEAMAGSASEGDLMQRLLEQIVTNTTGDEPTALDNIMIASMEENPPASMEDDGRQRQEEENMQQEGGDGPIEEIASQDDEMMEPTNPAVVLTANENGGKKTSNKIGGVKVRSRKKWREAQEAIGEFRRSLRLIDDPQVVAEPSPLNNNENADEDDEEWTVLKIMGLEEHDTQLEASKVTNSKSPPIMDAIETQECAPNIDGLIMDYLKNSSRDFPHCMFAYLEWIATTSSQEIPLCLTLEQAEVYRQVYTRWSTTHVSPSTFSTSTLPEVAIHQTAAELGSHRALSILQAYYDLKLMELVEEEAGIYEGERGEVQRGMEAEEKLEKEGINPDFIKNDVDLMKHICGRIMMEQRSRQNAMEEDKMAAEADTTVDETRFDDSSPPTNSKSSLNQEFASISSSEKSEDAIKLEIRYRWLIANLQSNEFGLTNTVPVHFAHTCTQLKMALHLIQSDWSIFTHANFGVNCLSKSNLERVLRTKTLQFQSRQIDWLTEEKRYMELKNVLISYDWEAEAEDRHANRMFLLIKCFQETNESWTVIVEWINKILSLLTGAQITGTHAKRLLRRCLNTLNDIFPATKGLDEFLAADGGHHLIIQLGSQIGRLANQAQFPYLVRSIDLWIWCHRIAKCLEGEVDAQSFLSFCDQYNSEEGPSDKRLPTRALLILSRAHEILGRARKCGKKEHFLRLILDEYTYTLNCPAVYHLLCSKKFEDVRENTFYEIIQCLRCAFSCNFQNQPKSRSSRYVDHGSKLQWTADWDLALKVFPLLIPAQLPEMSSDTKVPFDLVDTINKAFDTLLDIDQAQLDRIDDICENPPHLELVEQFDSDGLWCAYADRLEMDQAGKKRIKALMDGDSNRDPEEPPDENERKKEELKSRILYLLAHFHNRSSSIDSARKYLRDFLSIGHPHFPSDILSSAWYAYGQMRTFSYTILSDEELLKEVDAYLFPFKMAIFLNWDFPEAHLDLGTLMYQLRTRLMRFKKLKDPKTDSSSESDKAMVKQIMQKVEGMLQKARLHFHMAQRYNIESTKDVAWLTNYFLAKIAEKLGEPAEKVLELYYQSALDLEQDGVQYLTKINRTKQTYLEPVEIHYKVHSFAMRRRKEIIADKSMPSAMRYRENRIIHAYLRLFQNHGVQRRSQDGWMSAEEFYDHKRIEEEIANMEEERGNMDMDEDEQPSSMDDDEGEELKYEVSDKVDKLVSVVNYAHEIERLCIAAFEIILQRFPHYKAAYRLAENVFMQHEKNWRKSANILFEKLFLIDRKQRSNNFLENVIEIKRTDFERNGSFPYHLFKIVNLAALACYQCKDIVRLKNVIIALTFYKVTTANSRESLSEMDVRKLMVRCHKSFCKLIAEFVQKNGQDFEKLSKLIEYLEEVLQRLKKDKRFPSAELETLLISCVRRRDQLAPRVDDDIIPIGQPPTQLSRFSNLPGATASAPLAKPLQPRKHAQLVQNMVQHQQQKLEMFRASQQQQKPPKVQPIGIAGGGMPSSSAGNDAPKNAATTATVMAQLNLVEFAKQLQHLQQQPGGVKFTQQQFQQIVQYMQMQQQQHKQQQSRETAAKRPYPAQFATATSSSSTNTTTQQPQQQPCSSGHQAQQQQPRHSDQPPQKKLKRMDEDAVRLLQKAQANPLLKKVDSLSEAERDRVLKMFFEKLNYNYSYGEFASVAQQMIRKQKKRMQQEPAPGAPSPSIVQHQQAKSNVALPISHGHLKQPPSSSMASLPRPPPRLLTSSGSSTATKPASNTNAMPPSRMTGLPPTVKAVKQQQKHHGTAIRGVHQNVPSPSSLLAAPSATRPASKPAVAVVRPSLNVPASFHNQQQQANTAPAMDFAQQMAQLFQQPQQQHNQTMGGRSIGQQQPTSSGSASSSSTVARQQQLTFDEEAFRRYMLDVRLPPSQPPYHTGIGSQFQDRQPQAHRVVQHHQQQQVLPGGAGAWPPSSFHHPAQPSASASSSALLQSSPQNVAQSSSSSSQQPMVSTISSSIAALSSILTSIGHQMPPSSAGSSRYMGGPSNIPSSSLSQLQSASSLLQHHQISSSQHQNALIEQLLQMQQMDNIQRLRERLGLGRGSGGGGNGGNGSGAGK